MRAFVYIQYMFGVCQLPDQAMYWSSNPMLRNSAVADVMSKWWMQKLSQYFHLNNNEKAVPRGEPDYDPLFKVRPLLTEVLDNSCKCYNPGQDISIDEAMIKFNGRLSFKQFVKGVYNYYCKFYHSYLSKKKERRKRMGTWKREKWKKYTCACISSSWACLLFLWKGVRLCVCFKQGEICVCASSFKQGSSLLTRELIFLRTFTFFFSVAFIFCKIHVTKSCNLLQENQIPEVSRYGVLWIPGQATCSTLTSAKDEWQTQCHMVWATMWWWRWQLPTLTVDVIFFFDNFFSSMKLAQDLQARSTLMCSKIRLNRKGWPKELSASVSKKMKCGEVKFCQDENMVATLWKHKRPVAILSTNAEPKMGETEGRAPGGKKVAVPVPVLAYNRSMGGVDLFDQYASYYPVGRPSLKWWWYLCWWLFQVAMVNSFLLWKQNQPTSSSKRGQRRIDFHLAVMKSLLEGTCLALVLLHRHCPKLEWVPHSHWHTMERLPGNKKACYVCQTVKTRTDKGHTKKSVYGCAVCKPHFCKGQCFTVFHQELAQKVQTQ